MMGKSHGHDKRPSPQGSLQGRHERKGAELIIPRNGDSRDLQAFACTVWWHATGAENR
jgi:hypothetical protein